MQVLSLKVLTIYIYIYILGIKNFEIREIGDVALIPSQIAIILSLDIGLGEVNNRKWLEGALNRIGKENNTLFYYNEISERLTPQEIIYLFTILINNFETHQYKEFKEILIKK